MVLQQTLTPAATIILLLFVITSFLQPTPTKSRSPDTCIRHCGQTRVQYPFGFSPGCTIRLECNNNTAQIGGFDVQNVTENDIVVTLPAQCDRSIELIHPLFGPNFAPSWSNNLLLQDCHKPLNGCVIPTSYLTEPLNLSSCTPQKGDNVSCYSVNRKVKSLLDYASVKGTECRSAFSSFSVDNDGISLLFQRLQLQWWLNGTCSDGVCDQIYGVCVNVTNGRDGGVLGLRCTCNEGFVGDGFAAGGRCRRVSNPCNASRYMLGDCGGTTRVGALIGGIVAGALLMAGVALTCYCIKRRSSSLKNRLSAKRLISEAAGNSSVPFYTYKEIERATSGFSEKQRLGIGAYGTVYAGKLSNDDWVAIKRIRYKDPNSIDQVMNEIKLLSSVSHPNLVRLLGCCIEEGEPILVYEFMPNGTLCQHLQRERGQGLPWTIRLTIATQTANAIAYLHSVVNPPIYHRDIKSSNILLDYSYKSKVADFGLSRLGMTELSHISTTPQGTPGYLDPQYHQYFHLSDKSDVYSFGVVLVEIITALKVVDFSRPHSEVNLAALAIDRIGRGCVDEIIDPYLEPNRDAWTLSSIHNVAELAFRCLAFHGDMRPTMMEVAEELENIRLSAWVPNMCMASPGGSSCSSSDIGSEYSLGSTNTVKKAAISGRKLFVPQKTVECLPSLEEVKDSSPVSVQDQWLSEQSSPSTNSLLGHVVQ